MAADGKNIRSLPRGREKEKLIDQHNVDFIMTSKIFTTGRFHTTCHETKMAVKKHPCPSPGGSGLGSWRRYRRLCPLLLLDRDSQTTQFTKKLLVARPTGVRFPNLGACLDRIGGELQSSRIALGPKALMDEGGSALVWHRTCRSSRVEGRKPRWCKNLPGIWKIWFAFSTK